MGDSPKKEIENNDVSDVELPKKEKEDDKEIKKEKEDDPIKPHRPYPGFRKNFYYYFTEYSHNTGIQGFKYMGEQERTIFERLWWLVLFCVSLYICINLIIQTWIKWTTSPVLLSFGKKPTFVWQVPFPAVTICPETKACQRLYNYTENYYLSMSNNMTDEENTFSDLSLVCGQHPGNFNAQGNLTIDNSTIEFLMAIAPDFNDVLISCRYTQRNENCINFFTPILTGDGLCFTFNMLDKEELFKKNVFLNGDFMSHDRKSEGWNLRNGYPADAPLNTFPKRAMFAGASNGLLLLLTAYEYDLDYICNGHFQGFKIFLHNPVETPGKKYFRAALNEELLVAVKPDMMTTSKVLETYEAHRRQCYFPEERNLSFFQSYTQDNCKLECDANFILKKCNCVAYFMPHEENTPICGPGSHACMFEAQYELLRLKVSLELNNGQENSNFASECDCLPSCTSLIYNAETSQTQFNWQKWLESSKFDINEFEPGIQMTRVDIFFKEQQFITSERTGVGASNELYGITDFLANCGGILGLFTGFSFLSIVEIVYFLSLRLICNVKKHGLHYWSGSPDLVNNDICIHKK
ncbi:pickpocket protein 28-like isoform X2 [Sitophilus oryzae]|uniref:Pickpocket protein 28-like isoform X2 n=1 Tax=Sitophilus oryzae TaxID=7048 RepID=A0A6J2X219_SITOR|nr:pickpocket protein 28-like isoform X2 [Sitophilus oryzae]